MSMATSTRIISIRINLFSGGVGIGSDGVNDQTGITTFRVGTGFTDISFVGTGLSITGYGSTVVIDLGDISAATAGSIERDIIRLLSHLGSNINIKRP